VSLILSFSSERNFFPDLLQRLFSLPLFLSLLYFF
jgi:hypothetical protein